MKTSADASVTAAKAEAETAKAEVANLQDTIDKIVKGARTPSAISADSQIDSEGNPVDASGNAVKAEVSLKGKSAIEGTVALLAQARTP